jgi:hypothetical protein
MLSSQRNQAAEHRDRLKQAKEARLAARVSDPRPAARTVIELNLAQELRRDDQLNRAADAGARAGVVVQQASSGPGRRLRSVRVTEEQLRQKTKKRKTVPQKASGTTTVRTIQELFSSQNAGLD